jgi:hypothetical protein
MSRKYNKRSKSRRSIRRTRLSPRPKRKSRSGYKRKTSRGRPKKKMSKLSRTCKTRLRNKIKINLDEYKKGRYVSRQQAIAVSYAQIKKKYPKCSRSLRKK